MEKNARDIFKSNLIRIMSIRNKKQIDIARDLKIPLTTVNGWLRGTSYPRVTNMQNLADYLKVSMKDLTDDVDEENDKIEIYYDLEQMDTLFLDNSMVSESELKLLIDYLRFIRSK